MAKPGKGGKKKAPAGKGGKKKAPAGERKPQVQPEVLEDLAHWFTHHPRTAKKVQRLIGIAFRTPFEGEGKPEPLKHFGSDAWSRRITQADRLVYRATDEGIDVIQARYHY